jgi:hypothetical protein
MPAASESCLKKHTSYLFECGIVSDPVDILAQKLCETPAFRYPVPAPREIANNLCVRNSQNLLHCKLAQRFLLTLATIG